VARDVAQQGLDDDHALRAAKAAERGVALGVGLAAVRGDVHVAEEACVVGVEDRAVGHRAGEVGAEAAVGQHGELQAGDQAGVVEAHGVVVGKRVALAGDHEVVVAVQPQLDRALELVRGNGGPHGQMAGLGFLAAEAAAHAPALHAHAVVVHAQRMRHPVLGLARVLGAGIHQPLVLLLRQHIGDLAFQVEVLLPADLELAAEPVRGARQPRLRVAPAHAHRRQHEALRGQRLAHVQHGRQGSMSSATARAALRACITVSATTRPMTRPTCSTVSMAKMGSSWAKAARTGSPGMSCASTTPRTPGSASAARIHALEAAVRDGREDGGRVQRAAHLGDVVHVGGGAGHLRGGALVRLRAAAGG
jgi:hypothetical protein